MKTWQWLLAATMILAAGVNAEPLSAELLAQSAASMDSAVAYLRKTQNDDGSFGDGDLRTPITGLVATGLLKSGRVTPADPVVARALTYLEGKIQADGGIEAAGGNRNYATAVSVMAFAQANKDGKYKKLLDKTVGYLKGEQWDESEKITPENPKYGGSGYGRKSRPDLSNTAFMLEALTAAGLPKEDPAFQRAAVFIRRCQNLSGEGNNDLAIGGLVNDGGFYYTPAEDYNPGGGNFKEGLRSYGSMTYAGLKSFLHAGVKPDDPRVQAALGWIRKHYTLEENPGLGEQGLFYYYHTFAKALATLDVKELVDEQGKPHAWRTDLTTKLLAKQNKDGSWTNANKRWLENDPRLTTAYVLMALGETLKKER